MRLESLTFPLLGAAVIAVALYSERVVQPPVRQGPVRIVYWEKWTDFEGQAMRDVVDAFNRSQNRIFVDLLTVSGIQDKTLLAIAGGIPPDVAGLFGPNVAQYADAQAIQSLTEMCAEAGIRRENYIPVYWDIGNVRGQQFALPSAPASTALHYNRAMLTRAGLDPNRPPRTIEELDQMADRLVKREGGRIVQHGFLPSEPGWWNWGWGLAFGGKLWDGTKLTADDPANIRAYEWVQQYSRKYGVGDIQTFRQGFGNFSSPQNAFLSEKVAMVLQGVWMYNFIDKFAPKLDWAAAPFPYPADRPELEGSTFADMDVLVVPRGAKHPKEAFEFIKFVQSQRGMELLCMGQRKHSPLLKVSPEFLAKHPNPYIKLFTELPKSSSVISPPKLGIWPEYQAEILNAYDEIQLMRKSPKDALRDVQNRMQPRFEEYNRRLELRIKMGKGQ